MLTLAFDLLFCACLIIFGVYFLSIDIGFVSLDQLISVTFIVWSFGTIYLYYRGGISFSCLFLFVSGALFLPVPVFLNLGLYELPLGNVISRGNGIYNVISIGSIFDSIRVFLAFVLGVLLASFLVCNFFKKTEILVRNYPYAEFLSKFYWLFFVLICIKYCIVALDTYTSGYVNAVHLESGYGNHVVFKVVEALYPLLGLAFVYVSKVDAQWKKRAVIFLLPFMLKLATGIRGDFLFATLSIVVLYSQRFEIKISLSFILKFVAVVVVLFIMGFVRSKGWDIDRFEYGLLIEEIGSSLAPLAYFFEYENELTDWRYIFGYPISLFGDSISYTLDSIANNYIYAQHLVFHLSENKFLNGSTIGGSFLAEIYSFTGGGLGVLLFVFIMVIMIESLVRLSNERFFYFLMSYILCFNLIFAIRGSVFRFVNANLATLLIFMFIGWIVYRSLSARRIEERRNG